MSSVSVDASGQRAIQTTINDPARTHASIPTKGDDDLQITVGGVGEISVLVPVGGDEEHGPKLKLVKMKDGREAIYLKINGYLSATAYKGGSGWPHATISARAGVESGVEEELGTIAVAGLFAPAAL
jgi:hypothetical protein